MPLLRRALAGAIPVNTKMYFLRIVFSTLSNRLPEEYRKYEMIVILSRGGALFLIRHVWAIGIAVCAPVC